MTKQEVLEILSDGHTIIAPQVAVRVCSAVQVPFDKGLIHRWKSDPKGTHKGLTMKKENNEGVYTLTLSAYVADKLNVLKNVGSFIGRGFQAQAYAKEIAKVI